MSTPRRAPSPREKGRIRLLRWLLAAVIAACAIILAVMLSGAATVLVVIVGGVAATVVAVFGRR